MTTHHTTYPELSQYINGAWHPGSGSATLTVIDPSNQQPLGTLTLAQPSEIDSALQSADAANSAWRSMAVEQRASYLHKAASLLRERAQHIGEIITLELGRPLKEAVDEVLRSADIIDWNAETAIKIINVDNAAPNKITTRYIPLGAVAALTPWNVPVLSPARKISMALAMGCTCILKPAEDTPGSAVEVVRAFADAGLPAGVLNLLLGDPAQISDALIQSPVIRKISFTGSVPIGKHIAAQAGALMKPVTMELGGHNPVLIFDDADVDQVAQLATVAAFRNAGQICTSPTRFYVQKAIYSKFVDAFAGATGALKLGNGFDADSAMGPVVNQRRLQSISNMVVETVQQGATVVAGGDTIDSPGFFYRPTILTDIPADSTFMREEPFGPLAGVFTFDDVAEGISLCNDSPLGLAAYVFSGSTERAQRAALELEAGVIGINQFSVSRPDVPFGGVKDSGYGREGGIEGLKAFCATRTLV